MKFTKGSEEGIQTDKRDGQRLMNLAQCQDLSCMREVRFGHIKWLELEPLLFLQSPNHFRLDVKEGGHITHHSNLDIFESERKYY